MKLKLANSLLAGMAKRGIFFKSYQWVFSVPPEFYDGAWHYPDKTGNTVGLRIISGTIPTTASFPPGDTILRQPIGDLILYNLSDKLGLGWYGLDENDPLDITYNDLKLYTEAKPMFNIDNSGTNIKQMVSFNPDLFLANFLAEYL